MMTLALVRVTALIAQIYRDPTTAKEALQAPDRDKWIEEIKEELKLYSVIEVWDLVDRPPKEGQKVNLLDSKWVGYLKESFQRKAR